MLPPLLGIWGQLGLDPPTFSCTILKKDDHSPKKLIFLIGFVLPCIAIILCYSCIYWRVRKSRRKLKAHETRTTLRTGCRTNREKEDGRLTKLMLIIFICFVLCFLPLMLVNVFDDNTAYPTLHVLASILAWLSSVINPFIYAASNRQYRSAYKELLKNVKSNTKSVQMNTTSANKDGASPERS
ncbi:Trapped in endoderm 1 [Carabus blaptoides fortunei]